MQSMERDEMSQCAVVAPTWNSKRCTGTGDAAAHAGYVQSSLSKLGALVVVHIVSSSSSADAG